MAASGVALGGSLELHRPATEMLQLAGHSSSPPPLKASLKPHLASVTARLLTQARHTPWNSQAHMSSHSKHRTLQEKTALPTPTPLTPTPIPAPGSQGLSEHCIHSLPPEEVEGTHALSGVNTRGRALQGKSEECHGTGKTQFSLSPGDLNM